jgi:hypothetical protein
VYSVHHYLYGVKIFLVIDRVERSDPFFEREKSLARASLSFGALGSAEYAGGSRIAAGEKTSSEEGRERRAA